VPPTYTDARDRLAEISERRSATRRGRERSRLVHRAMLVALPVFVNMVAG
jgi:hypothetical protein